MKSLWANIFKHYNQADENTINVIRKIPIFEDLSGKDLREIERILHHRLYKKDELIFRQGDAGVGMYIIEKGEVAIRLEPAGIVVAELS
ncbi:MAG TPA: cyclic nucleotide-binding domain-containing protein, partial [Caldithrix sp.]|nr:cyclic nucleotide-binding domain-containing protein [Caldithrix sp.]